MNRTAMSLLGGEVDVGMRRALVLAFVFALFGASCSSEGGGPDPERFCDADEVVFEMGAPADQQGRASEARDAVAEWKETAPEEIAASVEKIADRLTTLIDVWEAGDFDDAKVDRIALDEALQIFFSESTDTASTQVEDWVDANCST